MTEERTQYTAPDEVTQLRRQVAQLDERLDAALRTINGFTDASSYQWGEYQRRIKELEATVERLEADNRRLRKLDSIPLDAFARYWAHSGVLVFGVGYETDEFEADHDAIVEWFNLMGYTDGDA